MAENALTKVARIAAGSAMGAILKDKDGNDKIVKPDGDANYLDLRDIVAGGSGTGGGDNPENPDNPSAGADYYAGSLADGEITERNLEWSGTDDPTKDLTVTFKDDPGSNPFGQYSGLTILGHIQKTVMTSGTKGAVSNLELNYDLNNVAKNGYFTTTSPYPIYISQSDIASGQELDIPINGIGEGLEGDNTKSAMIHLKYNSDKAMTISHEEGYVNDGNSAGATGVNYEFIVEVIATFSTQPAVAQLPSSINLFKGEAFGDIALSGVDGFFENCMDGIEITMDPYIYSKNTPYPPTERILASRIVKNNTFRISKDDLIQGLINKILFELIVTPSELGNLQQPIKFDRNSAGTAASPVWQNNALSAFFRGIDNAEVTIGKETLSLSLYPSFSDTFNGKWDTPVGSHKYTWDIIKVTPYKN